MRDGAIRVHVGCGADYWPGWVNVDSDPRHRVDVRGDYLEIGTLFERGAVREIAMIHSLNYLTLWQARDFFRTAFDLLSGDGRLVIETVDLERAIQHIRANIGRFDAYLEGVRALHAFGLEQLARRETHTPNAFSWTPWHLTAELCAAGFRNVLVLPAKTHVPWRDMRVEAYTADVAAGGPDA